MGDEKGLAHAIFRLASGATEGNLNLKPEAWRVLTQINGVRSIGEIASGLQMDAVQVAQIAEILRQAGMLEMVSSGPTPASATVVGEAFLVETTRQYARVMGPLAEFIIEDEIGALGELRELFPSARVSELVERLSAAIRDQGKRLEFQRIMRQVIQRYVGT